MTVKELIDELSMHDPDEETCIYKHKGNLAINVSAWPYELCRGPNPEARDSHAE